MDISKIIANLPPEKRAQVLARLRSEQPGKQAGTIDLSANFQYRFRSANPFDFSIESTEILDPDPGCVQIRAKASSLNFRDVMIASGLYPASPGVPTNMGSDYAGVIEKVGPGVNGFKPGDEVIALHVGHVENGEVRDNCHFIRTCNVYANCVCPKPPAISFADAACIPTVFLTAYLGLVELGRLKAAEKVLIHTASGGVGLAAVQIASWLGAEIFATAGTDEKRDYLRRQGIARVYDSRSTAFAETIAREYQEMDVILNTLSADLMIASMELMRPFGRFVHIDKKDVSRNFSLPMQLFANGISFQFLDISLLFRNPESMQATLQKIVSHFDQREFLPIVHQVFPVQDLKKALTAMARGTHIGKLVVCYE